MVRQYVPTSTGQQQQSFTISIMSTTNNLAKSLELGLDEKPERTRTRNTLSLFFSLAHTLQYSHSNPLSGIQFIVLLRPQN